MKTRNDPSGPRSESAIVIGAGAGGLAAAIDLARAGLNVTVFEAAGEAGGKIHQAAAPNTINSDGADTALMDAGPTVFTMRWIFEDLFSDAGADLDASLELTGADILARHAWRDGDRLDLFADQQKSADAIAAFAGPDDAAGYLRFCEESADIFETLREPFIMGQRPSHLDVVRRVGLLNMPSFIRHIKPTQTLWTALKRHFNDPRLRQLFGRYATYVGSSPFLTPATIMLVAHVEQDGVWAVKGGMKAVAAAMQKLAERQGATFQFNAPVSEIIVENGAAVGVRLKNGEETRADVVIFNGDASALGQGLLGAPARKSAKALPTKKRSLSAVTYCLHAEAKGFPLAFHNVFFGGDYEREFNAVFKQRTITDDPTVYLCAQDRAHGESSASPNADKKERLFLLINAPADGDKHDNGVDVERITENVAKLLGACGLDIGLSTDTARIATPTDFHRRFPASGGALYGQTCHGMTATMARAGAKTPLPGLYLAGGSVHPGAGVPMATMSGRLAAAAYFDDRGRRVVSTPAPATSASS
ncbi:MAG: 1-hydroxycarotenoid 3,4-desaturase CrtD [Pseudomonadota bacterium]